MVPKGSELGRLSSKAEGQGIERGKAQTNRADQEGCHLSPSVVLFPCSSKTCRGNKGH